MRVGIIGNGKDKFTDVGETRAKVIIRQLLEVPNAVVVSGHSPLGGVDLWAEEAAKRLGALDVVYIFAPKVQSWLNGYKVRNLEIATCSDELHVVVADTYPPEYRGRRFDFCYHCGTSTHDKSGACWTAKKFEVLHPDKKAVWHIVRNQP